jgi:hypothetical protein
LRPKHEQISMAVGVRSNDTVSVDAVCIFYGSLYPFVHHFMDTREEVIQEQVMKEELSGVASGF